MKRLHGKHNKNVCDHLRLSDKIKCNDWVVTTAFYSSIHFLDHYIFPVNWNGKELQDINEAHRFINSTSKHQTRSLLIEKKAKELSPMYLFLLSESQNARYVNYDVNEAISELASRHLERIITKCDCDKKL